MPLNRRHFLKLAVGAALAGSNCIECKASASPFDRSLSPLVKQSWISPPDCYFTYPHMNGFIPGTNKIVIANYGARRLTFLEWDFASGATRTLFDEARGATLWSDIADATGQMVVVKDRYKIYVLSTQGEPSPKVVYEAQSDEQIASRMVAFRPDGKALLFTTQKRGFTGTPTDTMHELDLATGALSPILSVTMLADHFQYSPFDPNWVGFCDGAATAVPDRVWGYHRTAGGAPQVLWDQKGKTGMLNVGHERWTFHKNGVLVCAYAGSPGNPRGLYMIDPEKRAASLISESYCDLHCNIDRTGTWAVVDTSTSWHLPGAPRSGGVEPDGRIISDIVLVNMATGKRYFVARSHRQDHPFHCHPHISPDGRYIVYNEWQQGGAGTPSRAIVAQIDWTALMKPAV